MTKEIRTDISNKRNKTFIKKKKNKLYHNSKRIKIETLIFNIYKTRKIIIHKRLSRRLTL